ncbi:hypothetical protein HELRODRAFT_177865 [Helobdella robusta]|uniref:Protein rolling stone n=1 Tax=Helobdella robusta TaxID=6412 RepID=T1FCD9_HELRO|nr:hypothetical protein HELRODRAFT_177865 [Helobdella robusta]ESN97800.1 hypothetical protein HELRODRAFT_177865 [Helobdella robusta]
MAVADYVSQNDVVDEIREEFRLQNFVFPIKKFNLFNKCQLIMLKISIFIEWMARYVGYCGSLVVVVCYYLLEVRVAGTSGNSLFDINSHILVNIIVLLDLLLSAAPFKLLHFVWVTMAALLYTLFTYIYFRMYDEILYYTILNWRDPSMASLYMIFGSLLCTIFLYCSYLMRIVLYNKWRQSKKIKKVVMFYPSY